MHEFQIIQLVLTSKVENRNQILDKVLECPDNTAQYEINVN